MAKYRAKVSCDAPIVRSTICKYIVEQDVISYLTANCRQAYYDFYSCLAVMSRVGEKIRNFFNVHNQR
jgi:hypothetical protein